MSGLLSAALITAMLLALSGRYTVGLRLYALQSGVLGLWTVIRYRGEASLSVLLAVAVLFLGIKACCSLVWLREPSGVERLHGQRARSLPIGIGAAPLVLLVQPAARFLAPLAVDPLALSVALGMLMMGLLEVAIRRRPALRALGLLVIENGLAIACLALAGLRPLVGFVLIANMLLLSPLVVALVRATSQLDVTPETAAPHA